MPYIRQYMELDITPEKFLEACSADELQEIEILIASPRYQRKMNNVQSYHQTNLIDSIEELESQS